MLNIAKPENDAPNSSFVREQLLIRLLMTFIATGLIFMLLPGTFLGVWNLFTISSDHSATAVSATWIQAHGHAQLFGWVGSFILGIGFYSIPEIRKIASFTFWKGWLCWLLWTVGVAMRWYTNVYEWQWQILLPLSAILELSAFALFFYCSVRGHKRQSVRKQHSGSSNIWALLVVAGSLGFLISLAINLWQCLDTSMHFSSPTFPLDPDRKFLFLCTWGAVVPIACGLSARWLPVLLNLQRTTGWMLALGLAFNTVALINVFTGSFLAASCFSLLAASLFTGAIHVLNRAIGPAKTTGVHESFPLFVRLAYGWLLIAAIMQLWAALAGLPAGIIGSSRHALTVGFMATLIFCIAPRMLPAFLGKKQLFSSRLMFVSLALLSLGCFLRVASEIVAYQYHLSWAWSILPASAVLELVAVSVFAFNMIATISQPSITPEMDSALSKAWR